MITMTQNQTETRPEISVGQAIGGALGQAQSVLAGLLVEKVEQAGIDRETYLALQRLGVLGDAPDRDAYVADLADWLDLDPGKAAALADGLVAAGLATAGQQRTVEVTGDGAGLRSKIAGSISAVTAPVYESLSASDVETTVRTLRYLTTGVRAVNSGAPSAPAAPSAPSGSAGPDDGSGARS
jgi:DNA-binding MarR family transcriptional regulator